MTKSISIGTTVVGKVSWASASKGAINNWGTQTALGDFNNDGVPDVAISINDNNAGTSDVRLLTASSGGVFTDSSQLLLTPSPTYQTSNIIAADLNNDGYTDLVLARSGGDNDTTDGLYGGTQLIYLSSRSGGYSTLTSPQSIYAHHVQVGDLNGDGNADALFFATGKGPSLFALSQAGGGFIFTTAGLPDKALAASTAESWDVLQRYEDGWLKLMKGFHQHNTAFNDVDRDGDLDMVMFFGSGAREGRIYFNDGLAGFALGGFKEFNAVISGRPSSGYFHEMVHTVGTNSGYIIDTGQGTNYYESVQMDVNGDGWGDIIAVATYNNRRSTVINGISKALEGTDVFNHGTLYQVLLNDGSGLKDDTQGRITQPSVNFTTPYHYGHTTMLSAVDLNGDGFMDFISNQSSGLAAGQVNSAGDSDTVFMLNDGFGHFTPTEIEGMKFGSFNAVPIEGKLGFIHTQVAGYDWVNRRVQAENEVTFIKTEVPWTAGGSGDDHLYGTPANDRVQGGGGRDIFHVQGRIGDYVLKGGGGAGGDYSLRDTSGLQGQDSLSGVECVAFWNANVNLTVQAKAASAPPADVTRLVELYTAFFNRVPDADGMSFWIDEMKSGKTVNQVAESFYNAGVNYSSLTGFTATMTNTDFINVVYKNVLGRKDGADAGGLSFWDGALTSGQASRGTLVTNILDSAHTFKGDKTWGWVADLLDNKITVAKKFSIDMGLNYKTPEESITKGMAIASAITSTDTSAAVTLIGVTEASLLLV
jgi:hypothetical protein